MSDTKVEIIMKYKINTEKCKMCRMCFRTRCKALKFEGKVIIDSDKCNGCGMCYNLCPANAIIMIDEGK